MLYMSSFFKYFVRFVVYVCVLYERWMSVRFGCPTRCNGGKLWRKWHTIARKIIPKRCIRLTKYQTCINKSLCVRVLSWLVVYVMFFICFFALLCFDASYFLFWLMLFFILFAAQYRGWDNLLLFIKEQIGFYCYAFLKRNRFHMYKQTS